MSDFLSLLKEISDDLLKIGHLVAPFAFKLAVINDVQDEFPEIAASIQTSQGDWLFEDYHDVLVSCEEGRKRRARLLQLQSPVTANPAFRDGLPSAAPPSAYANQWHSVALNPSSYQFAALVSGPTQGQSLLGPHPFHTTLGHNNSKSGPKRNWSNNKGKQQQASKENRPECQIYKKLGHIADVFYSRY